MDTNANMHKDNAIVSIFDTHSQAESAIKELQTSGFDMKKLSIIGKGFHSEEKPVGFYTTGDRVKSWGGIGAFWGGLWGMLVGTAFVWIPGIGPIAAAGPFVQILVTTLEGAAVVGGVSILGAALASLGVHKDSIVKYEREVKADKYLLIAHGDKSEVERARRIMDQVKATHKSSDAATA
jgi:hypothetical protein